jgi:hypothetical protein
MKYILLFPIWLSLFLLSLLIGVVMYSWTFSVDNFRQGTRFLNKHIKFSDWYEFSKF